MVRDDDEAWRAIVENYGERPQLDQDVTDVQDQPDATDTPAPEDPLPEPPRAVEQPAATESPSPGWDDAFPDSDWTTDRFVPPPPPPLPHTTTDRLLAWGGVFGSPAVLLVCLVLGIELPQLLAYLLVGAFIGGFVYLVAKMSKEPRDPGDDGAVV